MILCPMNADVLTIMLCWICISRSFESHTHYCLSYQSKCFEIITVLFYYDLKRVTNITRGSTPCRCHRKDESLQWGHHERDGVSNHQPHDCLRNRLFKGQIQENIEASLYWPLWGESTGDRWIARTKDQLRGKCFHFMTSLWMCWMVVINKPMFKPNTT